jgi:hypothetical protein
MKPSGEAIFRGSKKFPKTIDSLTIQNRTKKQRAIKKNKAKIGRKSEEK